jgi:hypothetical protein
MTKNLWIFLKLENNCQKNQVREPLLCIATKNARNRLKNDEKMTK